MATETGCGTARALLRDWRQRRNRSQMDLALAVEPFYPADVKTADMLAACQTRAR